MFGRQCVRLTRALKLDFPARHLGVELRAALNRVMAVGRYRDYAIMTKRAYNELVGQKRLWRDR